MSSDTSLEFCATSKWPFPTISVSKMAQNGQEMAKKTKSDAKGCLRALLTNIKARIYKRISLASFGNLRVFWAIFGSIMAKNGHFFIFTKLSHVGTLKLCQKMPDKILRELHSYNHSFKRKLSKCVYFSCLLKFGTLFLILLFIRILLGAEILHKS